jgi:S-disulfanyl-L-cysteine oxidoreductase SoxD
MRRRGIFYTLAALALTAIAAKHAADPGDFKRPESGAEGKRYGIGHAATAEDFVRHQYLVGPKGQGLPKGRGTAKEGRAIYMQSCAACHGPRGEGTNDYPALAGGKETLKSDSPLPTIGSYWPYATTVWDYINRAMPYQSPGSLKPNEVYAITAYLLSMNGIVAEDYEVDERTLPALKMPNLDGFLFDPRPDVK